MTTGTPREPEGTQLAAQLGDVMGGPEVPADPETEAVDLRRKVWNGQRLGESMAEDRDETVRKCGLQVLAVLGDAALLVAAVLTLPPDEFAALRTVAVATGLLPAAALDGPTIAAEALETAGPSGDAGPVVLCPTCLHDGVLERTLERAEAAEGKLAAILALPRIYIGTVDEANATVGRPDILAIIGTEGNEGQ